MTSQGDFFNGFKRGIAFFTEKISMLINSFLLLILYFLGFGLTSIIAKLFGKTFLETKLSKEKKSYWSDVDLKNKNDASYYKQF